MTLAPRGRPDVQRRYSLRARWPGWFVSIVGLGLVTAVALTGVAAFRLEAGPWTLHWLRDVGAILAYLAAVAYFVWKVRDGYLFVNLSVGLRVERSPQAAEDYLVVTLTLSKGDRATLTLTDIVLTVKSSEGRSIKPVIALPSTWIEELGRSLRISPGETVTLAAAYTVPSNSLCLVEANVQDCKRVPASEWRSAAISPPISPNAARVR
jgi:hypothetical protein